MIASELTARTDWRKRSSYDYLDQLARRDWSWEGLRRNPLVGLDWTDANHFFAESERIGATTIINCDKSHTALDRWGIVYSDPPDMDARCARVLWHPECYSGVLPMKATVADVGDGAHHFSLRDLDCPSLLFLRPGDQQHILFLREGRGLQLAIRGASVQKPVQLMIDASPNPAAAHQQLELLRCFTDLVLTGRVKSRSVLKEVASHRLKMVLQALDGALAGASHREIALAIYGIERVRMDWNDPREHLKDHIRKTVRRGLRWMEGGYRSFLK